MKRYWNCARLHRADPPKAAVAVPRITPPPSPRASVLCSSFSHTAHGSATDHVITASPCPCRLPPYAQ